MFDNEISGELPEHIDFIKNKAIPVFESWEYVEYTHKNQNTRLGGEVLLGRAADEYI